MVAMRMLDLNVLLTLCVIGFKVSSLTGKNTYTGIYSTFPKYKHIPMLEKEAIDLGYIKIQNCTSNQGNVYSKPDSLYLPGLIYNAAQGKLSGMVFGVDRQNLVYPDEKFSPFSYEDTRGQIYWFHEPANVCDPDVVMKHKVADGIWIQLPNKVPFRLPDTPDFANTGDQTDGHWTKHLCTSGMGTHIQYSQCNSQYQFTALYDAADTLVGVVNALNIRKTMDNAPELIETVPVNELLGIVFNETKLSKCYNLEAPRILIHVYLRLPEVEYQTCTRNMGFTPANNPVKRCALCKMSNLALLSERCNDTWSTECCCGIHKLYAANGGCEAQGCVVPENVCTKNEFQDQCNNVSVRKQLSVIGHIAVCLSSLLKLMT